MNINDSSVLDMINTYIACDRLDKKQILQIIKLVAISTDINDLEENIKWENTNFKI